jgi:hypothetical protein
MVHFPLYAIIRGPSSSLAHALKTFHCQPHRISSRISVAHDARGRGCHQLEVDMQLKRKRSDSELSAASSGVLSSSQAPNSTVHYPSPQSRQIISPSHQSGRTMKRFRDNRPSEEAIHRMSSSEHWRNETDRGRTHPLNAPVSPTKSTIVTTATT